ncbi:cation diffusion facilitator family transporter [Dasania marina]|uniref:cation diffusion facilitator family transporter n=1 Tax=Dasania marina TaxID=471499 RepID=UPI0030DB3213|tara:strand:+ start:38683 stop:39579 length:897 start_codon:yes stop_codon:yes gene_type:complete
MSHHHHASSQQRIGWVFWLNAGFTLIEFLGGWLTNSTVIMADAIHDLGDSFSIGMAWMLGRISDKPETNTFTYGYRRFSMLGALLNGFILIVGSIWILVEAISRLNNPQMPVVEGMFWFAVLGIAVNGFAAFKLSGGKTLNEKVLNWHLLEDVLGWVAILLVAIVLMFVDWPILDPILSIIFTLFIAFNVVKNLKESARLFLQGTPDKILLNSVRQQLCALPGVNSIHHLHLWSLDGEHYVLTAHLVVAKGVTIEGQLKLKQSVALVLGEYSLAHTTIEFELSGEDCRDESPNVSSNL